MDPSKQPSHDVPRGFTDAEMDELKSYFPDDVLREFKLLNNELLGMIERKDYQGIADIRDQIIQTIQRFEASTNELRQKMIRMKRDSRQSYARVVQQAAFLESLKSKKPFTTIYADAFPLGKKQPIVPSDPVPVASKSALDSDDDIDALSNATEPPKTSIDDTPVQLESQISDPEPIVDTRADHTPIVDELPSSEPPIPPKASTDHILASAPLTLAQEMQAIQSSIEEEPALLDDLPIPKAAPKKVIEHDNSETPAVIEEEPKKDSAPKVSQEKGSDEYYKERAERIRNYIANDQRQGEVDITESIPLGDDDEL